MPRSLSIYLNIDRDRCKNRSIGNYGAVIAAEEARRKAEEEAAAAKRRAEEAEEAKARAELEATLEVEKEKIEKDLRPKRKFYASDKDFYHKYCKKHYSCAGVDYENNIIEIWSAIAFHIHYIEL